MGKDLKGKELGVGLNQRKDGRYQARFTKKDGKRAEKNFDKITEAREWLSKEKYLDNILSNNNMTVDEWYNYWIENYKEGIVKDNKIFYEKEIKINAELFPSSKIVCVCIRQPIHGPASLFA